MNDNTITITRLLTDKLALNHSRIDTQAMPLPLAQGEALLKIARVALTTNNITYAAFGEAMQYWSFFPTDDDAWGHMPAWGFADVVASTVSGVEVGERFYGYFPIASHLSVVPERVTARGFYDGAEHRRSLTSAYNHYVRCSQDPGYAPEREDHQMIVRPLFITSFMLADFLQDNAYFGARQLVVSSASSKTAYGTAFCLQGERDIQLIALTSERNSAFVEGLGCYHQTTTYDALASIRRDVPTLYRRLLGRRVAARARAPPLRRRARLRLLRRFGTEHQLPARHRPAWPGAEVLFRAGADQEAERRLGTRGRQPEIQRRAARLHRAHRRHRAAVDEGGRKQGLRSSAGPDRTAACGSHRSAPGARRGAGRSRAPS